jgi:hypothetical protein
VSIVEKVRDLIANVGGGIEHAVHHLAAELDALKHAGLPAPDLEKIASSFDEKVNAFLADIKQSLGERADAIEARLTAIEAQLLLSVPLGQGNAYTAEPVPSSLPQNEQSGPAGPAPRPAN